MATYETVEEIKEGRKYHNGFLILQSGDSIKGSLVSSIDKIQGNSSSSSITITDTDGDTTLNVFENNCFCGPFGLSNGHANSSSKEFLCSSGEVIVYFKF